MPSKTLSIKSPFPSGLPAFLSKPFKRTAEVDSSGRISITPRQIYIIPTRFGLVYTAMLIAMLVGSNNYAINLGFVLTFLLCGIGLATMLQSWRNLSRLEMTSGSVAPVFCGETAKFALTLHNDRPNNRSALQIVIDEHPSLLDLPQNSQEQILCSSLARNRGYLTPQRWTVFSYFPTGLFYCWAYFETSQFCIIYPKPIEHNIPLEDLFVGSFFDQFDQSQQSDDTDFFGHREHQPTDSFKRIDWNALARGKGKLTKLFREPRQHDIWLKWGQVKSTDIETTLSILCRAVIQLADQDIRFGLELPDSKIEPDSGMQHRQSCLTALALFQK